MTEPDHGIDPMPPILYWSRSLAVHQIAVDGPMASLPGIVDMTAPTIPMAMNEGDWHVIGALPADAVWLAGGEVVTEWGAQTDGPTAPVETACRSREEAAHVAASFPELPSRIVSRRVTRGPWEVAS